MMTREQKQEIRTRLRMEIAAITADLGALKAWGKRPLAERGQPPATGLGRFDSRWRATLLCMLTAHLRRRLHLRRWRRSQPGQESRVASLAEQAALLGSELDAIEGNSYRGRLLEPALRAAGRAILAEVAATGDLPPLAVAQ
ncbi:MAG: hypothetical protein IT370_14840 [Deltaproteobacteria bacterium]|nr:hypothetical protein [Deltaproteobacteria bacterium]